MNWMGCKLLYFVSFKFLTMIYTIVRAGAVGAGVGAASRYGSDSDQMMRLRLRNTECMACKINFFYLLR
jgi:hypothetical protein